MFLRQLFTRSLLFIASLLPLAAFAIEVPINDFSLAPYSQDVNTYLTPSELDYSEPLLKPEYQKAQLQRFYDHYYASDAKGLSPWSEQRVKKALPMVQGEEQSVLASMNNANRPDDKKHYAENYKEHAAKWLQRMQENVNVNALSDLTYNPQNRAIAVNNTLARALPDMAPDFYHPSIPGEGFPFDNLQESSVWAGTPLYILTTSKDKAWSLVLTPDAYFAWVRTNDIAYASDAFIQTWQVAAQKGLAAITKTEVSVFDTEQKFQFSAYIGAVFPLQGHLGQETSLMIPARDSAGEAVIKTGVVASRAAAKMPLMASKKNMALLMKQLQNRPYGWGGAYFYNDCSQEMKSLFTPFAIWLPRNSGSQAQIDATTLDASTQSLDERLRILKEKGHPLMTLIYIGGHVMLYLGNKSDDGNETPMTYQNLWGLRNASNDKRYVIGQSAFLPLLTGFPERPDIDSQANHARFKLVFLDSIAALVQQTK